ncbi:MAG: hypothetical protein DSY37_01780 [Hyperthermus sp.]|nr:MAG: hypothetical protein DSY37_01780 [Hyperthermus sp.]
MVLRVKVRLISLLRDAVDGRREVEVEVGGNPVTLGVVVERLYELYPRLRRLVESLRERGINVVFLVNGAPAGSGTTIEEGDVVTLLPPASGG